LYMYDTDMELKLHHIEKLLSRRVPCVSGTYFMGGVGQGRQFPCVASRAGQYITRGEIARSARQNALIPVDGAGCGSLLVEVSLLKKLGSPLFKDEWKVSGDINNIKGEDVYFTEQVKLAGEQVFIDPTVIPLHFKEMSVGFDVFDMTGRPFYTPDDTE
jgi:hypothetical protein